MYGIAFQVYSQRLVLKDNFTKRDDYILADNNQRYYPISRYYKCLFGEKVFKVSVSIAEECPDRASAGQGRRCIYCDEWGSAAYHLESHLPLVEQIQINREKIRKRYKVNKFLVYFQAYTNTFSDVDLLSKNLNRALNEEDVCGIVIATRPDCIANDLFPVLKEISQKSYVAIELGVQSFFDKHLEFLNRGHLASHSISAINKIYNNCNIDIGIHLIFGLLNEIDEELIETARVINKLPIANIKLHNLHVLKNTPLAKLYEEGGFKPVELGEYARRVILFLRYLSPDIPVQRLAAVANRWEDLVAPEWTKKRMQPTQFICDLMKKDDVSQGDMKIF